MNIKIGHQYCHIIEAQSIAIVHYLHVSSKLNRVDAKKMQRVFKNNTSRSALGLQRNICVTDIGKLTSCFTLVLFNALCILKEQHDVVFSNTDNCAKVVCIDIARPKRSRKRDFRLFAHAQTVQHDDVIIIIYGIIYRI